MKKVLLGMSLAVAFISTSAVADDYERFTIAKQTVAAMKTTIPMEAAPGVTMSEITIKSGGLIVHYRLSSETAADFKAMGEEEAYRQIKSNGLLGGCPTAKPLLDVGLDMDNIFYDENDNVLGTFLISKETCNAQ